MLRRPEDPGERFLLDGVWYDTEDAYREALRKRDARRRRLLAWGEANERCESWHSFDARWRDGR
jgi:hypothetical protein